MKRLKRLIVIAMLQWHFKVARLWTAGRVVTTKKSKWRLMKFKCAMAVRNWLEHE